MTTFWVVWDGAAEWIVEHLITSGGLRAAAQLRKDGLHGPAEPPRPNCQTPPGLATLFSGLAPDEHGVTGFWVPGADGNCLRGLDRAFAPGVLRAPLVWETLAAEGFQCGFVHVPWVIGSDGAVDAHVGGAVEAYSKRVTRERAAELTAGETIRWCDTGEAVAVTALSGTYVRLEAAGLASTDVGEQWTPFGEKGSAAWYRTTVRPDDELVCIRSGV